MKKSCINTTYALWSFHFRLRRIKGLVFYNLSSISTTLIICGNEFQTATLDLLRTQNFVVDSFITLHLNPKIPNTMKNNWFSFDKTTNLYILVINSLILRDIFVHFTCQYRPCLRSSSQQQQKQCKEVQYNLRSPNLVSVFWENGKRYNFTFWRCVNSVSTISFAS